MFERIRNLFAEVSGERKYDAARYDPEWNPTATSVQTDTIVSLPKLWAKARDLYQNNGLAKACIRTYVNGVVGRGIRPQADTAVDNFNELVDRIFKEWAKRCTPEGRSFYSVQRLALRASAVSGECFIQFLRAPDDAKMRVPLWLKVYEADMVDVNLNTDKIKQGIEFDRYGRPTRYFFHPTHPGDSFGAVGGNHIAIPARDIIHFFDLERPGQVRGVTRMAPEINDIRALGDFEISELVKQKIAACFGLVFTGVQPEATQEGVVCDRTGRPIAKVYPGMIGYAGRGADVKTITPPTVIGYPEYVSEHKHKVTAGVGVPYAAATGDLRRVNFSSARFGQGYFERDVNAEQDITAIPLLCDPVWSRFITAAYDEGVLTVPVVSATWTTHAFPSVNPTQDAKARNARLRDGVSTLTTEVAREGDTFRAVVKRRAAENAILDAEKQTYDSDPRHRTLAGTTQPVYDTKTKSGKEVSGAGSQDTKGRSGGQAPTLVRP